jgi:hypothetical protein
MHTLGFTTHNTLFFEMSAAAMLNGRWVEVSFSWTPCPRPSLLPFPWQRPPFWRDIQSRLAHSYILGIR